MDDPQPQNVGASADTIFPSRDGQGRFIAQNFSGKQRLLAYCSPSITYAFDTMVLHIQSGGCHCWISINLC